MVLEITIPSIVSFIATIILLLIYAAFDLRTRLVPNRIMVAGGVIGAVIVILTGHLINQALLHLSAGAFTLFLSYLLFRIGALGGADVKAVVTIAIVSPGIEFASWSDSVVEGIVGSGLLLIIILLGAYIFSRYRTKEEEERVTPLLPIILATYLLLQLLALV